MLQKRLIIRHEIIGTSMQSCCHDEVILEIIMDGAICKRPEALASADGDDEQAVDKLLHACPSDIFGGFRHGIRQITRCPTLHPLQLHAHEEESILQAERRDVYRMSSCFMCKDELLAIGTCGPTPHEIIDDDVGIEYDLIHDTSPAR